MSKPITNLYGFPDIIHKAVQVHEYSKDGADFSATELQKPPLLRALQIEYADELQEDVVDRIWSLVGDGVHIAISRGATYELAESRWHATIEVDGVEYDISGQSDSLDLKGRELDDWKTAKTYVVKDGLKPDWIAQTNVYHWLLAMNGIVVETLKIGCLFKNWSLYEQRNNASWYPKNEVEMYDVPMWTLTDTEEYIRAKIHDLVAEVPRNCTNEERWQKVTKYACMKGKNKRALKVEENLEDLEAWMDGRDFSFDATYRLEVRPGAYIRCTQGPREGRTWCPVAAFCPIMNQDRPKSCPECATLIEQDQDNCGEHEGVEI